MADDPHTLPSIASYYHAAGRPFNSRAMRVEIGPLTVWFSYETAVAFEAPGCGLVVCENTWSGSTEAHLREIEGHAAGAAALRVPREVFGRLWGEHAGWHLTHI